MNFDIPILVEQSTHKGQAWFTLRPLFVPRLHVRRDRLSAALSRMAVDVRKLVQSARGTEGEAAMLTQLSFNPDVTVARHKLRLELRKHTVNVSCCVATFAHLNRYQAFLPADRSLWLEFSEQERVADRVAELLTAELKRTEKDEGQDAVELRLKTLHVEGSPWLTHLRMEIDTGIRRRKDDLEDRLSFFGQSGDFNGALELDQLGTCLDAMYPDDLNRALFRDDEVRKLQELLQAKDKRPVLIVGAPRVGKTTVIHESVYQGVAARPEDKRNRGNVWHLAPQKIVAGMSYVGQWENRVLAILNYMVKHQHVLYLDDMPGMFRAGVHSKSTLSAADVLKPFVERRDLQLLLEITPGQLRVFQERDRGFADLFQVLRLEASSEEDTCRILADSGRELEQRHSVLFAVDVVPTVIELTRRYERDAALPGKAARLFKELALRNTGRAVSREAVLEDYQRRTGLQTGFLDANATFSRADMRRQLNRRVLGQPEAVDAVCDVISIGRARLNDPGRPLGAFLFPGPTGVGKTHCAKSLAEWLYGDASRLLRFDMNEYHTSWSVARLVGTFDQPDGLLTSAVRQQPFCVILFDEIEKAHPDVYDLLLQVLGEARLTDSVGRTVDFSGAVIILTSNLGAREAAGRVGLGGDAAVQAESGQKYRKAVREFFRPEFINRFDRIIPFRALQRDDIRGIAETLLSDLLTREGFMRRKCCIDLDPAALECVIERGFQPTMGARAMRRALEHEIVRPVSRRLAEINPETPSIIELTAQGNQIAVRVHALEDAEPLPDSHIVVPEFSKDDFAQRMVKFLDRAEKLAFRHRQPGGLAVSNIPDEQHWYLGVVELISQLRGDVDRFRASMTESVANASGARATRDAPSPSQLVVRSDGGFKERRYMKDLLAVSDITSFIRELGSADPAADHSPSQTRLLERARRLNALLPRENGWKEDTVLVVARVVTTSGLSPAADILGRLKDQLNALSLTQRDRDTDDIEWFDGMIDDRINELLHYGVQLYWQPNVERVSSSLMHKSWYDLLRDDHASVGMDRIKCLVAVVSGFRAAEFLECHSGTHLVFDHIGCMHPVQIQIMPLPNDQPVSDAFRQVLNDFHDSREDHSTIQSAFEWRPVVSIQDQKSGSASDWFDLRLGTSADRTELRHMCELPEELAGGDR